MEYKIQFQGSTNTGNLPFDRSKNRATPASGNKNIEKPMSYNVFSGKEYSVKNARITKVTYVRK